MKCYFCLTAPDNANLVYANLFELSLSSALYNTNLTISILYDGDRNHKCYKIIEKYQSLFSDRINIINHKFSHKKYLPTVYPKNYFEKMHFTPISYDKLAGTFMRLDIPFLEKEEDYVFYTDIDVYFQSNVSLEVLKLPKYLSAAPEFNKNIKNEKYFNAGVLLLNVKNMQEKCNKIFCDLSKGIPNKTGMYDQGFLNQYCFDDFDILPNEYNWKPYWGINHKAKIVHYHGMKPGGTYKNSGFAMNEKLLYEMTNLYPDSVSGLIYYSQIYFKETENIPSEWLAEFVQNIVYINQKRISKNLNIINTQDLKHVLKTYINKKLK